MSLFPSNKKLFPMNFWLGFLLSILGLLSFSSISSAKEKSSSDEPHSQCHCSAEKMLGIFSEVAEKATPAVVFIQVEISSGGEGLLPPSEDPFDLFGEDFFRGFPPFYGFPPAPGKPPKGTQIGRGSGFLVSPDGYIMTNVHLVKNADKIKVTLNDEKEFEATLVGSDPRTDIAIIKIEGKNFPYLTLGDSDTLKPGQWVIAIGCPFQFNFSVTTGVVSATRRQNLQITEYEDYIQTDVAVNPGNSGGPLLNLKGEVVGINNAIFSRTGGYTGISFAISSKIAKNVMAQVIATGSVTRGVLGIALQPINKNIAKALKLDTTDGVLIAEVHPDSAAEKAGLQSGDVILKYNDIPVKSLQSFRNAISFMAPGTKVTLEIYRQGQTLQIPVTLGSALDTTVAPGGVTQKLGLEVEGLTPEKSTELGYKKEMTGVVITKVKPGSPAYLVGMRPGSLILSVNDIQIDSVSKFNEAMKEAGNKNVVLFKVQRGNVVSFYALEVN